MKQVIGPNGSATETDDNGEKMTMVCGTVGLSVGNTFFQHKKMHKTTWTFPDGKATNEIDYFCISSRWRSSLMDVHAYRGADVGSGHNLVLAKLRLCLKNMESEKPLSHLRYIN